MDEWWTYRPANLLMFSPRTYWRTIELYNEAMWPWHLAGLAAGVALLVLLRLGAGRGAALLLAACLAWVAWGFLYTRFATINTAAPFFAAAFAGQTALLAVLGGVTGALRLRRAPAGTALIVFAVALQPLVWALLGRSWAQVEIFGLAPDPTAVAALGVALFAPGAARWALLAIPLLWCALSATTLWTLGETDAALILAGCAVVALGGAVLRPGESHARA